MRRRKTPRQRREPTIALINSVFLMLVFFMVAGTLAEPLDDDLRLVSTKDLEGTAPPDALVISADGALRYRGASLEAVSGFVALRAEDLDLVRIVPDRDLPADKLVDLGRALQDAGAQRVMIVTERGVP